MFLFLFGFDQDVRRRAYIRWGVGLMAFKYAVEFAVFFVLGGVVYTPWDFANPLLAKRLELIGEAPEWFPWAWIIWTIPFAWIAVTMTIRRAYAAGLSPWYGFLVFVPYINLLVMFIGAILPDRLRDWHALRQREGVPKPAAPGSVGLPGAVPAVTGEVHRFGIWVPIWIGLLCLGSILTLSIASFDSYGASLFIGVPLLLGATIGFLENVGGQKSVEHTISRAFIGSLVPFGLCLLFGVEGLICIGMAILFASPLLILGSLAGRALASTDCRRRRLPGGGITSWIILLVLVPVEAALNEPQSRVVVTRTVIHAPPEAVWKAVLGFPPIEEPPSWPFRLGIAMPVSAQIIGEGVGAHRRCSFTTGDFVEPITAWEPPHRLAFDVSEQPPPMRELSLWDTSPPHLDGFVRALRGEFRLIPLGDGRTRIEGRTWYTLDIHPVTAWAPFSDSFIHAIHRRVLRHIVTVAERDAEGGGTGPPTGR